MRQQDPEVRCARFANRRPGEHWSEGLNWRAANLLCIGTAIGYSVAAWIETLTRI